MNKTLLYVIKILLSIRLNPWM